MAKFGGVAHHGCMSVSALGAVGAHAQENHLIWHASGLQAVGGGNLLFQLRKVRVALSGLGSRKCGVTWRY